IGAWAQRTRRREHDLKVRGLARARFASGRNTRYTFAPAFADVAELAAHKVGRLDRQGQAVPEQQPLPGPTLVGANLGYAARRLVVLGEGSLDVDEVVPPGKPDEEVEILEAAKALVESPGPLEAPPPDHRRLDPEAGHLVEARRAVEEPPADHGRRAVVLGAPVQPHTGHVGVHDAYRGVGRGEGGQEPLELARQPHVVAVLECQERPASVAHTLVAGGGLPPVGRLPEIAYPLVGKPPDHVRRAVRGAIVDDDQLQIALALPEHALNGAAQEGRPIESWKDDARQAGVRTAMAAAEHLRGVHLRQWPRDPIMLS